MMLKVTLYRRSHPLSSVAVSRSDALVGSQRLWCGASLCTPSSNRLGRLRTQATILILGNKAIQVLVYSNDGGAALPFAVRLGG